MNTNKYSGFYKNAEGNNILDLDIILPRAG